MKKFTRDIPPIRTLQRSVDAKYFNAVRLGLLRMGDPLQFSLTRLPLVDVRLSRDSWLCIDGTQDQLQLLEWTDFKTNDRGLHEPVPCTLNLFHVHSGLIIGKALDDIVENVQAMMENKQTP